MLKYTFCYLKPISKKNKKLETCHIFIKYYFHIFVNYLETLTNKN